MCLAGVGPSDSPSAWLTEFTDAGVQFGGPCPIGHYCPAKAKTPTRCERGTTTLGEGGRAFSDCQLCQGGWYCPLASPVRPSMQPTLRHARNKGCCSRHSLHQREAFSLSAFCRKENLVQQDTTVPLEGSRPSRVRPEPTTAQLSQRTAAPVLLAPPDSSAPPAAPRTRTANVQLAFTARQALSWRPLVRRELTAQSLELDRRSSAQPVQSVRDAFCRGRTRHTNLLPKRLCRPAVGQNENLFFERACVCLRLHLRWRRCWASTVRRWRTLRRRLCLEHRMSCRVLLSGRKPRAHRLSCGVLLRAWQRRTRRVSGGRVLCRRRRKDFSLSRRKAKKVGERLRRWRNRRELLRGLSEGPCFLCTPTASLPKRQRRSAFLTGRKPKTPSPSPVSVQGTYAPEEGTPVCLPCPAGYLCYEGVSSPTPIDPQRDGGEPCPEGHYCPEGSFEALPCPPGTFNSQRAVSNLLEGCLPCAPNTYSAKAGQAGCLVCGSSSSSVAGSTTCTCTGKFRVFQHSDGSCVCRDGYESYDGVSGTSNYIDSPHDCQPIVQERCSGSQVWQLFYESHSVRGDAGGCETETTCAEKCNGDGRLLVSSGRCICGGQRESNFLCDQTCRYASRNFKNTKTALPRRYFNITPTNAELRFCSSRRALIQTVFNNGSLVFQTVAGENFFPVPFSKFAENGAVRGSVSCEASEIAPCLMHFYHLSDEGLFGLFEIPSSEPPPKRR